MSLSELMLCKELFLQSICQSQKEACRSGMLNVILSKKKACATIMDPYNIYHGGDRDRERAELFVICSFPSRFHSNHSHSSQTLTSTKQCFLFMSTI
ncbi:hypothetical protein AQUCO_01500288v1 [Aquilegia coerulea]|uniref:Uncharacterized protein n=1 Tax=Aquilegia coerulea TaxID=218851 RepID=A0A2G5DTQ2_AQUCA|nr:hypothetical protein AQUCO_01500288v1 [Aquilegia coerulea]